VGQHRIQGISDEFIPPIVDLDFLDEVVAVDDGDAILMAQKLARELGIAVGISSGANFLGALKVQSEMGREAIVVTVFPDDNKSTSHRPVAEEPVKEGSCRPRSSPASAPSTRLPHLLRSGGLPGSVWRQ
jgi:cysteine synthase A